MVSLNCFISNHWCQYNGQPHHNDRLYGNGINCGGLQQYCDRYGIRQPHAYGQCGFRGNDLFR